MEEGTRDIIVNINEKQLFNAALGKSIRDASKEGAELNLCGYAVTETLDLTTGEMKTVSVLLDKDGTLYSGTSIVMENRLRQFSRVYKPEDVQKGIKVKFVDIKCGRGTGTSLMVC